MGEAIASNYFKKTCDANVCERPHCNAPKILSLQQSRRGAGGLGESCASAKEEGRGVRVKVLEGMGYNKS